MYASTIRQYISKWPAFSRLFSGIYSADTIPDFIDIDHFVIVNTDTKDKKGSHWWTCVRRDVDFCEQFDPLSVKDKETKLLKHLDVYVERNSQAFQPQNSRNCALFVLYFLAHRYMNFQDSFTDLLHDIFTTDRQKNEELVLQFFHE